MNMKKEQYKILGIETSCDDTGIAIINSDKEILSNIVINQNVENNKHGGIVPEVSARSHLSHMNIALEKCLNKAKIKITDVDIICSTGGPGLIGGLLVGTTFAKTLSWSLNKPYVAVNHLEGHALTARLVKDIDFPYLLLLVSGGHTQIIAVKKYGDYKRISTTLDDAAGETFDKGAKMLKLKQPGGIEIEKISCLGNELAFDLPRPMFKSKNPNFSFSGLKTSFRKIVNNTDLNKFKEDLAASLQLAICDCIVERTNLAIKHFKKLIDPDVDVQLVVAGGVAANKKIRSELKSLSKKEKIKFFAPPTQLCTDNGAMIAWAGFEKFLDKGPSSLNFKPRPRWPLDLETYKSQPTMKKIGKKGIKA